MHRPEPLRKTVERIRPDLEAQLVRGWHTSYYFGEASGRSHPLQLRLNICGITSRVLGIVLAEQYGIKTELVDTRNSRLPDYGGVKDHFHVRLHTSDEVIDPTYGQYMGLFGLRTHEALRHDLIGLYPEPRIAVYPLARAAQFAEHFAAHAHARLPLIPMPDHPERAPFGILRYGSLDESTNLMQDLWDPEKYHPHTHKDEKIEKLIQADAREMAEDIMNQNR